MSLKAQESGGSFTSIKNADILSSHGNIEGRKVVLQILEVGYRAADPYPNTRKLVHIKNGKLLIGSDIFDLSEVKNIYVIGAGKAVQRMAKAFEDVLGERLTGGHINIKKGEHSDLRKVEVTFAGHPLPDESSVEGAKRIKEIAEKATKDDIVIYVGSGGATALSALSPPEVSIEDLVKTYLLLYYDRGIPIWELNIVRHHLSLLGGGRMNMYVYPAKYIYVLTNELWPEETLSYVDPYSTFKDAINIVKKYEAWDELPQSVKSLFERADPKYELPSKEELSKVFIRKHVVMTTEYMLKGAKKQAEKMGIKGIILAQRVSSEARDAGRTLASIAREIEQRKRPFKVPCALITGGELIVTMGKSAKMDVKGGRNQEFALASGTRIEGSDKITVGSIDSDGTDGPTDVAGGMSDGYTMQRAKELNVDVHKALQDHNSYEALTRLQDTIYTGSTGTNVQDLRVIYISD